MIGFSLPILLVLMYVTLIPCVALFIYKKRGIKIPDNLHIPVIVYSVIIASMLSLAITSQITIFPAGLFLLLARNLIRCIGCPACGKRVTQAKCHRYTHEYRIAE